MTISIKNKTKNPPLAQKADDSGFNTCSSSCGDTHPAEKLWCVQT